MDFILTFESVLQIVLESLPISSSGHLLLVQKFFAAPSLSTSYEYLLHGPTIMVLIIYFRAIWVPLLMHCLRYRHIIVKMLSIACVAQLMTVPLYFFLQRYKTLFPLWLGFLITALLLISTKWIKRNTFTTFGYGYALLIGCVQGCAALPGISRFASTYAAGVWCGLSPRKAFQVSCMVQFPLICAGFLLGIYQHDFAPPAVWCTLSCGLTFILATIAAYGLLYLVENLMVRNKIYWFGYYLLIPMSLAFVL